MVFKLKNVDGTEQILVELKDLKKSVLQENLDLIDTRLEQILSFIEENLTANDCYSMDEMIMELVNKNPCKLNFPDIKYPYILKQFLFACYSGMCPDVLWNGDVREQAGDRAYKDGSFEVQEYLFAHCVVELSFTICNKYAKL